MLIPLSDMWVQACRRALLDPTGVNGALLTPRRDEVANCGQQLSDPMLPRKASQGATSVTVPQTDSGRQVENTKARERTLAKELGKLTP